jgi:hypothetical protein
MLHKNIAAGSIHVPYNWSYANAAARTGATGFVAGDLGTLARQTDNDSLWMLTATTPTWVQVGVSSTFTSGAAGLAPASGGGTSNYLRADGTWAAPSGGGGGSVPDFLLQNAGII